jgi:hypothetical protein
LISTAFKNVNNFRAIADLAFHDPSWPTRSHVYSRRRYLPWRRKTNEQD